MASESIEDTKKDLKMKKKHLSQVIVEEGVSFSI